MKNRIGILTNIDEACGNAAYARILDANLKKWYAVRRSTVVDDFDGGDVVIINYHPAVVHLDVGMLDTIKAKGMKSIIILQNSTDEPLNVGDNDILKHCDAVVAHEEMTGNVKVNFIPHGIQEVNVLPLSEKAKLKDLFIGTAGFPFPWKRFDVVAEASKKFNQPCLMIAPRSPHADTDAFVDGIKGHIGELAHIHREWLSEEDVIGYLSMCAVNIFWYESKSIDDTFGQTGSARMGVSAKRPMIISRHRKFKTLWPYEDELYIADKEEDVYKYVEEILSNATITKKPNRIFKDMGWSRTSEMYKELIESL